MERTLSVEEKIRRAEAIYERRQGNTRPVATIKEGYKAIKKNAYSNISMYNYLSNYIYYSK